MKSENKNFLLNIIYQMLTFILPLVTLPYISRVLGVDNVGIYTYTYSVVYMFMLVGMLGVNNYGNRAIAAVRDNKDRLSKTFCSIYYMQLICNIVAISLYFIYLFLFCDKYIDIAVCQSLFLFSVCLDVNWFYFGIEKFKLTILRNIIVKVLSLLMILIFVRTTNDTYIYTLIMSGATLFSQLYLILLLPKYVTIQKVKYEEVCFHFKGIVVLFVPVLAYSIYRVMDKTMIGAIASVTELGYYEAGEKIMNIPCAVITALGTVMLPRMSYILSKKNVDYKTPILSSMKLAMKLATIMCAGLILIADELIIILFGVEFAHSSQVLKLLSVTILASAWANVIRTQFLIPLKEDKIYIKSTILAAFVNLILNVLLIRRYGAIGACIGTLVAEFFIAIYQTIATWKELEYMIYLKNMLIDALKAITIVWITYIISSFVQIVIVKLITKIIIAIVLFIIFNAKYLLKDFVGVK